MNDVLNTALGYHQRGLLDQAAQQTGKGDTGKSLP
jgi:hypothetical protein